MILQCEERNFSWLDQYNVQDDTGKCLYHIKGIPSWGNCLKIYDAENGGEIGMVQEKALPLVRPQFMFYEHGKEIGIIHKDLSIFTEKYSFNPPGWTIRGNFLERKFRIQDDTYTIATIRTRDLHWGRAYELRIRKAEDAVGVLAVLLAVQASHSSFRMK